MSVFVLWDEDVDQEETYGCPACGDTMDYCTGHGASGDPVGHRILWMHDEDDHSECHPAICGNEWEQRPDMWTDAND